MTTLEEDDFYPGSRRLLALVHEQGRSIDEALLELQFEIDNLDGRRIRTMVFDARRLAIQRACDHVDNDEVRRYVETLIKTTAYLEGE